MDLNVYRVGNWVKRRGRSTHASSVYIGEEDIISKIILNILIIKRNWFDNKFLI